MDGLTEGRIVHVALANADNGYDHIPAIVTKVIDKDTGEIEATAFPALSRNVGLTMGMVLNHSDEPRDGAWHFIERA